MKRFYRFLVIATIGLLIFAGKVSAVPISNPDPFSFGNDLGDSGLFVPSPTTISIEIFDLGGLFGIGSTFGFFFATDPGNLITIFDPSDQDPDPGGAGSIPQVAIIDFSSGTVLDVDDSSTQDTFVAGTGNVGFFLTPNSFLGIPTLYTLPSLNAGEDLAATFPLLTSPLDSFLIAFETHDSSLIPPGSPLVFEVANGITPVPEPATLLLLGSGLVGLAGFGRKMVRR